MEAHDMRSAAQPVRRLATETKQAFKTTEFWVFIAAVIAVLIAGTVDDAEGSQFGADDVWLLVTLLTIGYLLSRGIAKSGSRDPYWDRPDSGDSGSLTDRLKAAAEVLTDGEGTAGRPAAGDQTAGDPQARGGQRY